MIWKSFLFFQVAFATLEEAQQAAFEKHNELRGRHQGTPVMTMAPDLNEAAQTWANHMRDNDKFAHAAGDDRPNQGENIAWAMNSRGLDLVEATVSAVQQWYDEIQFYDWTGEGAHTGVVGHFTQVVWAESTELGMGAALSADGNEVYVVGRYRGPGNWRGEYIANVFPLAPADSDAAGSDDDAAGTDSDAPPVPVDEPADDAAGADGAVGSPGDAAGTDGDAAGDDGHAGMPGFAGDAAGTDGDAAGTGGDAAGADGAVGPPGDAAGTDGDAAGDDGHAGMPGSPGDAAGTDGDAAGDDGHAGMPGPPGTDHDSHADHDHGDHETRHLNWNITWPCEDSTVEDAEMLCNTQFVGIRIPKCAFRNAHIREAFLGFEEGVAQNESCSGRDEGDWRYFDALEDGCSTRVETNQTHMTYSNHVGVAHGRRNAVISRRRGIYVEFVCAIANEATVTLEHSVLPLAANVDLDLGTEETSFNLHMGLYDRNFTAPLPSDVEIFVPDQLHIRLSTEDIKEDSDFKLKVRQCWATPGNRLYNSENYTFIDDYCGNSIDVDAGSLSVFGNGAGSIVDIHLDSFQFIDHPFADIFIHCKASLCGDEDCEQVCGPVAPERRRRSADFVTDEDHVEIAVGPIHVRDRN